MLDFLLNVVSGGATGLLGTVLSGGLKYFTNKQEQAHELAVMEMQMRQMDKEAAIARDIKELEMEGEQAKAAWAGLEASYKEAGRRWSTGDSQWIVAIDVVRGLMRPVLTLGLLGLTAGIYFTLATDDIKMSQAIVQTVLYTTTTALLWWFGSRQLEKK